MNTRASLTPVLLLASLAGCAEPLPPEDDGLDGEDVSLASEEIRSVGSPPWIYTGLLPSLIRPKIVVSLGGHTLRVTGELPAGFDGPLPFYARGETVDGKRMVTVVYPIATGASASLDTPGEYTSVTATPYRPNGMAYPTTGPTFVRWGGFPFMAYNGSIAFHGPITYTAAGTEGGMDVYEWYLQRGPVSHGCNRMQGEHVVELAHLLGFNMRNTWASGQRSSKQVYITVTRDYDRLPSGEAVDVDYPRYGAARAPTGPVRMFPTWSAEDFPRFVCADKRTNRPVGTVVGMDFCDYMPENLRDPVTGEARGPVVVDNSSRAFSAQGAWFVATKSPVRTGANYMALNPGAMGSAAWTLPVVTPRRYRVWVRYAPDTNRNTRALYRVYPNGTDTPAGGPIVVNQRESGAQGWYRLGEFMLAAGARVTVTASQPGIQAVSDGYTVADAVRIEPVQ